MLGKAKKASSQITGEPACAMESSILKTECLLRLISLLLSILAASLIGFDSQTKSIILSLEKTASFTDASSLVVLVIVISIAAGYNLIQLCKWVFFYRFMGNPRGTNKWLAWVCFLLDQTVAYVSFAANSAVAQLAVIALSGVSQFQWPKVCNVYTRFCEQMAGGLLCGFSASLIMVVVSSLSAFNLFRLFSSRNPSLIKGGS